MPAPEDDDPRDDEEGESSSGSGFAGILIAVFVTVIVIFATVGGFLGAYPFDPPPGTTTCSTTCMGFVRLECPGNRMMGLCFGISVCDRPTHTCGIDPPP
jgi:hypothetical protein